MGQADDKATQIELQVRLIPFSNLRRAHVATDRMHRLASKNLENRGRSQVAGMDDDLAGTKTVVCQLHKLAVGAGQMGVGENACSNHGKLHGRLVNCLHNLFKLIGEHKERPYGGGKSASLQVAVAKRQTVP